MLGRSAVPKTLQRLGRGGGNPNINNLILPPRPSHPNSPVDFFILKLIYGTCLALIQKVLLQQKHVQHVNREFSNEFDEEFHGPFHEILKILWVKHSSRQDSTSQQVCFVCFVFYDEFCATQRGEFCGRLCGKSQVKSCGPDQCHCSSDLDCDLVQPEGGTPLLILREAENFAKDIQRLYCKDPLQDDENHPEGQRHTN